MTALAGLFHRDGSPVDRALLRRIRDAAPERGGEGTLEWTAGAIGLGCQVRRSTSTEAPLFVDDARGMAIVLHGRIDNREEIAGALEAAGLRCDGNSDAELVLRAYALWGRETPAHLLGDFALAVWDGPQRQLFCARDVMGVLPFFYRVDARRFVLGSELRQVLAAPWVAENPNEGMIAEYLTRICSREETVVETVMRLPPAHALQVDDSGFRTWRYWSPDPGSVLAHRSDPEFAAHFLDVFRAAVRARLRAVGPVGAWLSGGSDSSSVVSVAQDLLRRGEAAVSGLATFSVVFPPGHPCDETRYQEDVIQRWPAARHTHDPESAEGDAVGRFAEMVRATRDLPDFPAAATARPLKCLARASGCRVLLTGLGGDEWLSGSDLHYADLLRSLRLYGLVREFHGRSGVPWIGLQPRRLLHFGLRPLVAHALPRVRSWLRGRHPVTGPFPWIPVDFARRVRLDERLRGPAPELPWRTHAQRDIWEVATSGFVQHTAEVEERYTAHLGLEQRHPLLDRRLIELALALPEEQRWRGPVTKVVLREAMRGLLPESVRTRRTKASFSHAIPRALAKAGGEHVFLDSSSARNGWIDGARAARMYREMSGHALHSPRSPAPYALRLWMMYSVDVWANGWRLPNA